MAKWRVEKIGYEWGGLKYKVVREELLPTEVAATYCTDEAQATAVALALNSVEESA